MPRLNAANLAPRRNDILERFVDRFSWVPQWEAEVTLADEGLENRLITIDRYAGGAAVRSQLSEAHKFRREALADKTALSRALTSQNRFQPVEFKALNDDEFVERAIAKHLLFSEALREDKWPVHTERRFARKLRPYILKVRYSRESDPDKLESDWYDAYTSSSLRDIHWLLETRNASLDPRIQIAIHQPEVSGTPEPSDKI